MDEKVFIKQEVDESSLSNEVIEYEPKKIKVEIPSSPVLANPPAREYLDTKVFPTLFNGVLAMRINNPTSQVDFLANYLHAHREF
ncbi:protein dpy-30 homolog [Teleopsis dalmanni]|uniref:protein dpy-30 homolog n=1 Tax=Teleopsis dalmanni TaxID=139649 RepID=UPI0018CCBECD|nr:protein dpy-30 homolog [Teleopsis dalmanni]